MLLPQVRRAIRQERRIIICIIAAEQLRADRMLVSHTFQPVIRKLKAIGKLAAADVAAVAELPHKVVSVGAGTHLIRQGEAPALCYALLEGYAYRAKAGRGGKSQILSFHMPGDLFDLRNLLVDNVRSSVVTLGRATVAEIRLGELRQLKESSPAISDAFWQDTLIDAAIYEEWVLNIGQRDARSRMAHLFAEFAARRSAALPDAPARFLLPMTQTQIAAATGITPIHTNRVLAKLRAERAISSQSGRVLIDDTAALRAIGGFDASYLDPLATPAG